MSPSRPGPRLGPWHVAVDVPHLLFILGAGGWVAWYGLDALRAGANIQNLSLIAPCVVLALGLALTIIANCFTLTRATPAPSPRAPLSADFRRRILGTMALLALYVAAAPFAGFDIATFVYILATLAFLGERRPFVLFLIPAVFCAVAIYGFDIILETPLPLLFQVDPT